MIFLLLSLASISGTDSGGAAPQAMFDGGKAEENPQKLSPVDYESSGENVDFWRKAHAQYELGRTSEDKRERSVHFRRAEVLAQQAIQNDPQCSEGYKWLAIALGAQVEDASVEAQIRLSRQIKENIDKALSLDPDDDISMLVLSRWHYKVASLEPWTKAMVTLVYGGLPHASLEKAEDLLLRGIARKDRIAHRYNLAKVYHRMGRHEAALDQLRMALTLPVTFDAEAEDVERARKKLSSWK